MNREAERQRLVELAAECERKFLNHEACKTCTGLEKSCYMCKLELFADHLLDNGVIVPPVKVGDKFYKVERWCTEGGYWEKPRYAYSSTCEDCCEECDGEDTIIGYTFNSPKQILSLERQFGKYVFLTREEAEKMLKGTEK